MFFLYYKINLGSFSSACSTSNFRFEEARSAITLLRCFLHENTQRGKIARVKFAEELGTMSENRLRWITLVRGPIWGIHSLTLMISWLGLYSCIYLVRFSLFAFVITVGVNVKEMSMVGLPEHPTIKLLYLVIYVFFIIIFSLLRAK